MILASSQKVAFQRIRKFEETLHQGEYFVLVIFMEVPKFIQYDQIHHTTARHDSRIALRQIPGPE